MANNQQTKQQYLSIDGLQFKAENSQEVVKTLWSKANYPGRIGEYMQGTARACSIAKQGCTIRHDTPDNFVADLIFWGFLARVNW